MVRNLGLGGSISGILGQPASDPNAFWEILMKIPLWLGKPKGSIFWLILAIVLGLVSFPLLLIPNAALLSNLPLVFVWVFWGLINAYMEEIYWRGFLLDFSYPKITMVAYSTLVFIALHPLMWGVFSKAQAFDLLKPAAFIPFGLILAVLSIVYALIYLKTKSLRWAILSHFISDLGNLSIFVFMNMISLQY